MIFDFNSDFKSKKIKYAVFVGRFQPFLKETHFDFCLKGILNTGLKPILLFGSGNESADFEKFNPLNNPLSNEQRIGQFGYVKSALFDNEEDRIGFAGFLDDKFDNDIWFRALLEHLIKYFADLNNGDSIENAVFFRVGKDADLKKDLRLNPPSLSHFDDMIIKSPLAGILSPNCDVRLLDISATKYRKISVLSEEFKNNVIAFDYIKNLVSEIRRQTIWGEHFNKINLDLTMLDLSLYRLCNEAKLDSKTILNSNVQSVEDLEKFLIKLIIK